jgi:hypothetical protein
MFTNWLNFGVFSCGLLGILMLMLAVLAFLRGRHKITNMAGVLIIIAVLLGVTIALSIPQY